MKNIRTHATIDNGTKVANSFATMKRNSRLLLRRAKRHMPFNIDLTLKVARCYSIRAH